MIYQYDMSMNDFESQLISKSIESLYLVFKENICVCVTDVLFLQPYQGAVIGKQSEPVGTVLGSHAAALLLIDSISLNLGQAEESTDHAQVLPQRAVLWAGILLPPQKLTQPALQNHTTTLICKYQCQ